MKSGATIALGLIALTIGTAIVIGSRLSDQAVAILAGAACGVGLAAPLSIALGVIVGMSRAKSPSSQPPAPPQVVVIPPPSAAPNLSALMPISTLIPAPRSFTIIGDAEEG